MHRSERNGSEWHGKDEKQQDSKDKNMQWKGEGRQKWGGDIVKESSTSERRTEEKAATRGGIARGLRGGIKYFNHRLSCYKNAFDSDSKALF